ncbi:MAG: hypothetical protein JNJ40_15380 [Bacteroidia bacterium]|nr:hypothetical protein [Bacteroidia bacterium]
MSQYDFQNFLTHSHDDEVLFMAETCFTKERLKQLVISQPGTILSAIRKEFKLLENYEVAELIHRLNRFELSKVLKNLIPRDALVKELIQLSIHTKDELIKHNMDKEIKSITLKLNSLNRVIESNQSVYSMILDLNDQIEICNKGVLVSADKNLLIEHRITLKNELNELVLKAIQEEFGELFKICINAKPENKLPERINIHNVFKNTIIFDFQAKRGIQDVIFNGCKLSEGNYFCIIWLADLIGFPDTERFITLYHYNIETISSLIGEMYVYDSAWNGYKVCGVLFNQGEEVLEPKYSMIEVISDEYFKAYRINPTKEKDGNAQEIVEGWQYYNKYGKRIHDFEEI